MITEAEKKMIRNDRIKRRKRRKIIRNLAVVLIIAGVTMIVGSAGAYENNVYDIWKFILFEMAGFYISLIGWKIAKEV